MIPPRWTLRVAWALHQALFRLSGGRFGTSAPSGTGIGTLFLRSTGRRSGAVRRNALFYLEDGPNLAVVASNAGATTDPAWWLNLRESPDAEVELGRDRRPVRAREATASERDRLWTRFVAALPAYEEYRRAASRPIPIVVLEPRTEAAGPPG